MEDAVSVRPDFLSGSSMSHFFGVFDGDGCSHVRILSLPAAECLVLLFCTAASSF
jgi:hypothetical protein